MKLKEECAIFGVYGMEDAAEIAYLGLYSLQHRGQESSGIITSDGGRVYEHRALGLVAKVYDKDVLLGLKGNMAIGHNRYSTMGLSSVANIQPLLVDCKVGKIAVAHNGNLVNAVELRRQMETDGSIFRSTTDSEVILHLIARSRAATLEEMIMEALRKVQGAFSLVFLTKDKVIAARDTRGFRPLCLGRLDNAYVIASESCAFDIIGAMYMREIAPGELCVLGPGGPQFLRFAEPERPLMRCIFEFIYFSRPDSWIFGEKVDKIRRRLGKQLANEAPAEADIVIAIPDSANTAALGYAQASGKRFEIGLIRNHYVGRTFIAPHQKTRKLDVKVKFNPVGGVLEDRRVIVVDDSIVRGTTMQQLVRLIRSGGAKEVHVRISSPPVKSPCFYGIDISSRGELIGASQGVDEIRQYIKADSLAYLSVDGMLSTLKEGTLYCTACFTGKYPTQVPREYDKFHFSCCGSSEDTFYNGD